MGLAPQVFVACKDPDYLQMTFHICTKVLGDRTIQEMDAIPAPKLIESIFQNCRGMVDQWLDPYISLAVQRMGLGGKEEDKPERMFFRDLLMQVVANSLYYNASLTIQVLIFFDFFF